VPKSNDFYSKLPRDFYEEISRTANPVRWLFHTSRWNTIRKLVEASSYSKDKIIIDVGCGNCMWNVGRLPVVGIDVNKSMLDFALKKGNISKAVACDFTKKLPLRSSSADIIVSSEVLEHITNYSHLISEFHRVLKPKGRLVLSVPYDVPMSLWRPLFTLQCFLRGTLMGEEYYKRNCGHINAFSPETLKSSLEKKGFRIIKQKVSFLMTIFILAEK